MLGEMLADKSTTICRGSVAYVAQEACKADWANQFRSGIQGGTVRDNILFGNEFDQSRYQATLDACCLQGTDEMMATCDEAQMICCNGQTATCPRLGNEE